MRYARLIMIPGREQWVNEYLCVLLVICFIEYRVYNA